MVDSAISIIVGHLFLAQAVANDRKKRVARRFIDTRMATLEMNLRQVLAADMTPIDEYELLAGPVPVAE